MKRLSKKWLLPLLAVLVLLLVIAWMAGALRDKVQPGVLPGNTQQVAPAEAIITERVRMAVTEAVPATIGARQATTVSSRIMARISRINVRAGDTVTQGQLLLELERSDLASRLSQSQSRADSITARLTEATLSLERAKNLQAQGLIARAVLDEARATHDALQADLFSAQRAVEEARVAISYAEIRSPIDGRVVDRYAEPGDTASPGERLLAIYNPLSLRIEAAVRESLALPLQLGQTLQVEIPTLGKTLTAEIEELVPAADPGSRSFLVKARVEFLEHLLPGMYARLLVPAGSEDLLLIPQQRVSSYGQLDVVWVWQDGQPRRRYVRLGRSFSPDLVAVVAGLDVGEALVPPPQD